MTIRMAAVCLAVLALASIQLQATPQLTADQVKLLEAAHDNAMAYTGRLPNFICTQITVRTQTASDAAINLMAGSRGGVRQGMNGGIDSDRIVERLTYFNQQENYKVVSINGKDVANVEHLQLGGAISSGEFGTMLFELFAPYTHTVFTWRSKGRLRTHFVQVFDYQVPQESGVTVVGTRPNEQAVAAYHGEVYLDADSKQILRITSVLELPLGFSIIRAERSVDYEPTSIANNLYILPLHSAVAMESAGVKYDNSIDFKEYRKYTTEATVRYGSDVLEGTPRPASIEPAQLSSSTAQPPPAPASTSEPPSLLPAPIPAPPQPVSATEPLVVPPAKAAGQAAQPVAPAPVLPPASLTTQPEQLPSTRLRMDVNLVLVPVVARNGSGQAVGNLSQEEFEIYDEGKRQTIASFTIEQQTPPPVSSIPAQSQSQSAPPTAAEPIRQTRFLVYFFDDLHCKFADLVHVRDAAQKSLTTLQASDQVALITSSGLVEIPFTSDHAKFTEALGKLRAEPLAVNTERRCPNLSEYEAGIILAQGDNSLPMQMAIDETFDCAHLDRSPANLQQMIELARKMTVQTARNLEAEAVQRHRAANLQLRDVVRWLAKAPGKRIVLLASPGFNLNDSARHDMAEVIDEAIRAEVVINALDARGLYVQQASGDIEQAVSNFAVANQKAAYQRDAMTAASELMEDLAAGTGGAFVHNSNDLAAGAALLTSPPEFTYLIGFKPSKLKLDGRFHTLKVKLLGKQKLTLQTRKGYFAPKP